MSDAALIGEQTASHTAHVHETVTDPSKQEFVNGAQPHRHSIFGHNHKHEHGSGHDHQSTNATAAVNPTLQSRSEETTPSGDTSRITTDGNIIRSSDPTAHPKASLGDKLKGDMKGAINGTVGSLQAAAGVATKNHTLEQKGRDKMSEEDARLGVKHGVMPVGSSLRTEEIDGAGATK